MQPATVHIFCLRPMPLLFCAANERANHLQAWLRKCHVYSFWLFIYNSSTLICILQNLLHSPRSTSLCFANLCFRQSIFCKSTIYTINLLHSPLCTSPCFTNSCFTISIYFLTNSCSTQSLFCKSTFYTIYIAASHSPGTTSPCSTRSVSFNTSIHLFSSLPFPKLMVYTVHVLPTPLLPPQPTSYRFVSQSYVLHFNVYNSAFCTVVLF